MLTKSNVFILNPSSVFTIYYKCEVNYVYMHNKHEVHASKLKEYLSKVDHTDCIRISIRNYKMCKIAIKCILKCQNIKNIGFYEFTDKQWKIWDLMISDSKFINNKHLKYLMIFTCNMQNLHIKQFSNLLIKSNIRYLSLPSNTNLLTNRDLDMLGNAIPKTKLENIDISIDFEFSNHVKIMKSICSSKTIKSLNLHPNNTLMIHNNVFDALSKSSLIDLTIISANLNEKILSKLADVIRRNNTIRYLITGYNTDGKTLTELVHAIADNKNIIKFDTYISDIDDLKYLLSNGCVEMLTLQMLMRISDSDLFVLDGLLRNNIYLRSCCNIPESLHPYLDRNEKLQWKIMRQRLFDMVMIFNDKPPYIICWIFDWMYLDGMKSPTTFDLENVHHRRKIELIMGIIQSYKKIKNIDQS